MRTVLKLSALLFFLAAFVISAAPAQAVTGSASCSVNPGHGEVGTKFAFACSGFSANTILNVYAVEPDGRASGLNIYGFFPTAFKTDSNGAGGFTFVTEFPGLFSAAPGRYVFVIHELVPDGGGAIAAEVHVPVGVDSSPRPLVGATLSVVGYEQPDELNDIRIFAGSGWLPFDNVNIWVSQPPAQNCSGLGIDQLTLGVLAGNGSSLWSGPGTVKADANGNISFSIDFRVSACVGRYSVSARSPGSGIGAETSLFFAASRVGPSNTMVWVTPSMVPAFKSLHTVYGSGYSANVGVNCWYTRPDGRVLSFINVDTRTDATGSFAVKSALDDFPPYTSTEPGQWHVTCATPDRSELGDASFWVYGLMSDP